MKVLLIHKNTTKNKYPPLGLAYIATQIRDNNSVRIIDLLDKQELNFDDIASFNPDIIGFSIFSTNYKWTYENIKKIKGRFNSLIVAGGPHVAAVPGEVIKHVDVLVVGEGEKTFSDLLKALKKKKDLSVVKGIWYKKGNEIIKTPLNEFVRNLDDLKFPARHLLNMEWYTSRSSLIRGQWLKTATMVTSRGCPNNCIFCSCNLIFGKNVRFRSAKSVVDEIDLLIKRYGVEAIWFCDDTLLINKEHAINICDEIIRRKIKIKWAAQARVDQITPDLCKKLKKAGCIQLDVGVESGSQKVLNALKKGTTVEKIIRAVRIIKKSGLRVVAGFMIGNPEETYEDVKKTEKLIKIIKPHYSSFYISTPLPATELYRMALKNGWLKRSDYDGGGYGTQFNKPIMNINFSDEELLNIRRRLSDLTFKYDLRSYIFNFRLFKDIIRSVIKNPSIIPNSLKNLYKTKSLHETSKTIVEGV